MENCKNKFTKIKYENLLTAFDLVNNLKILQETNVLVKANNVFFGQLNLTIQK